MTAYEKHLMDTINLIEKENQLLKETVKVYKKYIEDLGVRIQVTTENSHTKDGVVRFERITIPEVVIAIPIDSKPSWEV